MKTITISYDTWRSIIDRWKIEMDQDSYLLDWLEEKHGLKQINNIIFKSELLIVDERKALLFLLKYNE